MRSLKNFVIASTLALGLVAPAAANADAVDDLLNKVPAGEISCSQASKYWTNDADFASKRSQALAVATVHPRGAEIRSALSRIDDAATRCGLRGTTGTNNAGNGGNTATNPAPTQPAPSQGNNTATPNRPAPAPEKAVLSSQALPANIAAMKISVPGVGTFTVAQLIALVNQFLAQWNIRL